MNTEIIIGTFIIVIILYIIYSQNNDQKEHFNEGTFYQLDPNVQKNLDSGLYPLCKKDIRSTATGDRYCNDKPSFKKYTSELYGSPHWAQTKYPSYFYPPWSTSHNPHFSHSPDWHHYWKEL
jgi:hypothetical protein